MNIDKTSALVSVSEAQECLRRHIRPKSSELQSLLDANRRVAAEDLKATFDLPHFRQSSVDGYGVADERMTEWIIVGETRAGITTYDKALIAGEAIKVFTGSFVPNGVTSIAMVERSTLKGSTLTVGAALLPAEHIREVGSHVAAGATVLERGERLTPPLIGTLASLGVSKLRLACSPTLSLIITGDEIRAAGTPLSVGTVYDSNSFLLRTAIEDAGYNLACETEFIKDDLPTITETLRRCSEKADIVIISGGMSVGEFDFGPRALQEAGGQTIFHKVAQRPGKPLLFGKIKHTLVFGLPGNPVSTLVCFVEYVLPALKLLEGQRNVFTKPQRIALRDTLTKPKELHCFLRGKVEDQQISILPGQLSYNMRTFSDANALVSIPAGVTEVVKGTIVDVHTLPWSDR